MQATSAMRTGFLSFGMKEDSLCRDLQRAAAERERQSNEQDEREKDVAAGTDARADTSTCPPNVGLGQSAGEAEEDARLAEETASQDSDDLDDVSGKAWADGDRYCFKKRSPTPESPPRDDSEQESTNIMFATFDPPDPQEPDAPGHFCVVAVNVAQKRFELLDSLRGPNDPDGKRVLHTMASNIKKLWREASNSKGESFSPSSIDGWEYHYVNVPRQLTTRDCRFFMLQFLLTYDGTGTGTGTGQVIFTQNDILHIRMTLLYGWLTGGGFNIDLRDLLGVDPGPALPLDEDNFSLFNTEYCTPEVLIIPREEFVNVESKTKKKASAGGVKVDVIPVDEDDDFVTQLGCKLRAQHDGDEANLCSASSSANFVTQQGRFPPDEDLVILNKRPSKSVEKLRVDVPEFTPYVFPRLSDAKQLKEEILSKKYLLQNGQVPLVQFTNPIGVHVTVNGNTMYKLFGRGKMMESEIMDYIINYWKDDAEIKKMFDSGDRVLLGPFTIPYLLDFIPFELEDSKGNPLNRSSFDVKAAARMFGRYMRPNENLLTANLIIIPHFMHGHHTLYVMNKYTCQLDIFDSRRYAKLKHTTRNKHH